MASIYKQTTSKTHVVAARSDVGCGLDPDDGADGTATLWPKQNLLLPLIDPTTIVLLLTINPTLSTNNSLTMTTTRNYDEEIERFIGGDARVNDLKLVVREGEGGNYDLAKTFFRFLGEQEATTHLDSLSIEIPWFGLNQGPIHVLMEMLTDAFADTKLRTIKTLKVKCERYAGAELNLHGLVLSFRDGRPLQVENLDLKGVNYHNKRNMQFLALFLVHNKGSLKHLSFDLSDEVPAEMAACLGLALTQLTSLTSLEIFGFLDGLDLLYAKISEIVSLEKLTICCPFGLPIVDCIGKVMLPKLTRLTHFGLIEMQVWSDKVSASLGGASLGGAIQAHPSINSLLLDTCPIPMLNGMVPFLQKLSHLKLSIKQSDQDEYDEDPPEHIPTVSEILRNNPTSFVNLETFDLHFYSPDALPELAVSIGATCPRLEKLTLSDVNWQFRQNDKRFPQPAEKETLIQIARMCPSLYYLNIRPPEGYLANIQSDDEADCYELAKEIRKIRLGVDDIVENRISAEFPDLLAKSWDKTENDHDVLVNLDVVFELFQEKAGMFFSM